MKLFWVSECFLLLLPSWPICFFCVCVCVACQSAQTVILCCRRRSGGAVRRATADMHIPHVANDDMRTRKTNLVPAQHAAPCNKAPLSAGKTSTLTLFTITHCYIYIYVSKKGHIYIYFLNDAPFTLLTHFNQDVGSLTQSECASLR